jgi:hypothetical protein
MSGQLERAAGARRHTSPGVNQNRRRFVVEAAASLPALMSMESNLNDVYAAMSLQRVRLKNDQQVPEWAGERYIGAS